MNRKNIFTILLSFLTIHICFSQDVIKKRSGEEIQVKIIEVTTTEVKYKKFDNQEGPVYALLKTEIIMIRYENGTMDVFNHELEKERLPVLTSLPNYTAMYMQGQKDALRYYKSYKAAGTATLVIGLLSPLAGLVPAIACASTRPKDINLDYPSTELMKDQDYYNGYVMGAKKIKAGKVWKNLGIAFGVNIAIFLIASSVD